MKQNILNGHGNEPRKIDVVLGAQWGDEGKGKIVDNLALDADIVARCAGGNNAGHTVIANGKKYDFHLLPSGIVHKHCTAVIGNGVVLNLTALWKEIEHNGIDKEDPDWAKRLIISSQAHVLLPLHMIIDAGQENNRKAGSKIGTTGKGIGPCYADKARRGGLRIADLLGTQERLVDKLKALHEHHKISGYVSERTIDEELTELLEHRQKLVDLDLVRDTPEYIYNAARDGKRILVEGANGVLLDIDHGTYPFVTSSNSSIGGVITGLGIGPRNIGNIIGIVKAYQTRVGAGPFPTELDDPQNVECPGKKLRDKGQEYGVTTGRPRRCGWLDLVLLKYSCIINSFTAIALTKLDILDQFTVIPVCIKYKLNGVLMNSPPANATDMAAVTPIYKSFKGWNCDTTNVTTFDQLPQAARDYIAMIEGFCGVYIRWIGVGASRSALIDRGKPSL